MPLTSVSALAYTTFCTPTRCRLCWDWLRFVAGWPIGLQLALIWLAHIGMDRLVGYGLKYRGALKETHLGRV